MDRMSVFVDSTGKRGLRLRLLAVGLAAFLVLLAIAFAISLLVNPVLPAVTSKADSLTGLRPVQSFAAARRAVAVQKKLLHSIATEQQQSARKHRPEKASRISAAYFAPWQGAGVDSFRAHASQLTDVFAVWLRLAGDGSSFDTRDWNIALNPRRSEFEAIARENHVHIIPVIANAAQGDFFATSAKAMLSDPKKNAALRTALVQFVNDHRYDGLQIDFENLDTPTQYMLARWLKALRFDLGQTGKTLSTTVQTDWDAGAVKAISSASDYVVGMVYDAHDDKGAPGAIAPAAFVQSSLQTLARAVGSDRLVMGFGVYGYDWSADKPAATALSFSDAMALAKNMQGGLLDFDEVALNPTFNYRDSDGMDHEVWFQDGITAANQLTMGRSIASGGAAMWLLGSEDPSVWSVFGKATVPDLAKLKTVPELGSVQFSGDGELLTVLAEPQSGERRIEIDPQSGLIMDVVYTRFPSSYLIARRGAAKGKIALTFDDGPDPEYTSQILAILRKYHVPATFFVIGQNAENHPDLMREMLRDGDEIGSHSYTHPNMGLVSNRRAELELNATQRALESITGRTIRLFRPPFNADAEPRSSEEVRPVVVANRLGYIVAGETIDPLDWYTDQKQADGSIHKLTADEIIASIDRQLGDGNTILLHDSGGDRTATVAALDKLIPQLRAKGYRFTTMGGLADMSTLQTMPPMDTSQLTLVGLDRIAFYLAYGFQHMIAAGFILAIGLGLLRILFIAGLAFANRKHQDLPEATPAPSVDVVIAAYNEVKVIVATIESVLASRYNPLGVIVVDDGSTDGTAAAVKAAFAQEARVRLIEKENGGKASALNLALTVSTADIIVGVDADTQLHADAVGILMRHFVDDKVAAVAGNVKVGNQHNLLTRWQSLEYITSQNLDRVGYEALNCITVVPGAIGAWRRQVVLDVGGYQTDTMAEDMDLTWRLHRRDWRIANETRAIAYTEAPDTFGALFKQRFRWTYGTLQCLWKHRSAMFRHGAFGWIALPSLWVFQIAAQLLAPFVDLQLLWAGGTQAAAKLLGGNQSDLGTVGVSSDAWVRLLSVWLIFLTLEWLAGYYAYRRDRENPRALLLLPLQRFAYRQIMYLVLWKAAGRALGGLSQSWGKLDRTATVVRHTADAASNVQRVG
jgi:peptidoglycan-N-acetylglucosamine deacetylase